MVDEYKDVPVLLDRVIEGSDSSMVDEYVNRVPCCDNNSRFRFLYGR